MLKESCCHSEAGLEQISRDAMQLPQDRINNISVISDRHLAMSSSRLLLRGVITSLGNLLQC